ncbi:unnamed protein product, partial [Prunus brigantina]
MRLRFGMMTPNLLDLAAIVGLRPHGDDFSAANLSEFKVGLDFHKSNKTSGSLFLGSPKSGGITKAIQALAEVLVDGHQVAMGPIFLAYLYRGLHEEFKDAKEVTTLTNFNQDLVKSFSIPIRDPRFGDSNIFIHWWKEMSAGWFSQPCSKIEDIVFRHCPCSLIYQQEKEKKKAHAKADTTEKGNSPTDIIEREGSTNPANANSGRGEKMPNAPFQ